MARKTQWRVSLTSLAILAGITAAASIATSSPVLAAEEQPASAQAIALRREVVVDARNASPQTVLETLSRDLGFELSGQAPHSPKRFLAPLKGTLAEIVARVLVGTNYVLVTQAGDPTRLVIYPHAQNATERARAIARSPVVRKLRGHRSHLAALSLEYEKLSRRIGAPKLASRLAAQAYSLRQQAQAVALRIPN